MMKEGKEKGENQKTDEEEDRNLGGDERQMETGNPDKKWTDTTGRGRERNKQTKNSLLWLLLEASGF